MRHRASRGAIWTAIIQLFGTIMLGWGYFSGNRTAFTVALLVIVACSLTWIVHTLQVNNGPGRTSR
jgi:hypothetical protein